MSDNVIIFDTTLRDGEQALQASLSVKEKLQIAFQLERMGVDIIEAGFPVSSPGDFQSVQTIAREIKNSRIAALSRCVIGDIDAAAESLKVAEAFRLHMVLATSGIHVKTKLRKTFADIIDMAVGSIKHARRFTDDVEFSCEDAGAPISMIYAVLWKPRLTQEPPRSIFRTPSVTPHRTSSAALSVNCSTACRISTKPSFLSTAMMIWACPLPIPSPPYRPVPARLKVRSTG